jgi:hypothetical protein
MAGNQGRSAGYRIGDDQSAGIAAFCNRSAGSRSGVGHSRHFEREVGMTASPPIVFSNSGFPCQALRDYPCRAHCSLRGRGLPSA